MDELLARIRVALRHAERATGEDEPAYEHGDLKVDISLRKIWPDGDGTPEAVRLLVHQIRHRLERDPVRPKHIKTEPGVGYRLESDS